MDFDWIELTSKNIKFKYKLDNFTQNSMDKRFSNLQLPYMLITIASYGGPIALTSDKTKIILNREQDLSINNIVIFSNEGEINKLVKLINPFKNVVRLLQFTQEQQLLVIFQLRQQWLIDPNTGNYTQNFIVGLFENQQILAAKLFQNSYVIFTNKNRFLFVRSVYQPEAIQFTSCEKQLLQSQKMLYWKVFSPKQLLLDKIELHLCHPVSGLIQIVENQSKKVFYNGEKKQTSTSNRVLNFKGLTYISDISPNRKNIAYFSAVPIYKESATDQIAQNMKKNKAPNAQTNKQLIGIQCSIIFAPSMTSEAIGSQNFETHRISYIKNYSTFLNENNGPKQIYWCGNKAVVIQYMNESLYLHCTTGDCVKIQGDRPEKSKWSFLKQEVDGVRIVTKTQNKILRQIPASYININQSLSEEPGALLFSAYSAFQNEAPIQDDQIRKQKKKLAIAVEQCLKASRFEINLEILLKLMKSATYGKAFLPPNMVANNLIFQNTKIQRIINIFRQKKRYITFEQFQSLTNDQLLKILLRYREHYFAFQIYQSLKKDQNFRAKISIDWACCKVENMELTEDIICQEIRAKLEDQQGISFTEIAHKAIEIGRNQLALRLLSFEPALSKKVPLLLWMALKENSEESSLRFYDKALEDALRSRDLNLLFLVIRKIITSNKVPQEHVRTMFTNHSEGRPALINYFRLFDSKSLVEYYRFYLNDLESVIMEYLKKSFAEKSYQSCIALFKCAIDLLKQSEISKDDWRRQAIPKLYVHLCEFTKSRPHIRFRNDKEKPVTIIKQLQHFIRKNDSEGVVQLAKSYNIDEKRVALSQVKVYLDLKKWDELDTFVTRNQSKFNLPVEMIADRLLANKREVQAMRLMAKMPSDMKEEQYMLLQRIGKIKEVIDLAADRKDIKALDNFQQNIMDVGLRAYIDQKINSLPRK